MNKTNEVKEIIEKVGEDAKNYIGWKISSYGEILKINKKLKDLYIVQLVNSDGYINSFYINIAGFKDRINKYNINSFKDYVKSYGFELIKPEPKMQNNKENVKEEMKEEVKASPNVVPDHYKAGKNDPYEVLKIIQYYKLNFCMGNAVKYVLRCGKKDSTTEGIIEDLEKAREYLKRQIEDIKNGGEL